MRKYLECGISYEHKKRFQYIEVNSINWFDLFNSLLKSLQKTF